MKRIPITDRVLNCVIIFQLTSISGHTKTSVQLLNKQTLYIRSRTEKNVNWITSGTAEKKYILRASVYVEMVMSQQ